MKTSHCLCTRDIFLKKSEVPSASSISVSLEDINILPS